MLLNEILEHAKSFIEKDEFLKNKNIHLTKMKYFTLINFDKNKYHFYYLPERQDKNNLFLIHSPCVIFKSDLHNDLTKAELEEIVTIINKLEFAFRCKK